MNRLRMFFKIATLMFITSGTAACGLYFGMQALLGHPPIVVAVPLAHVAQYQNQYPIPYLLTFAFVFAVVSALWLVRLRSRRSRLRPIHIAAIPFVAVLLAGPIWGMLWTYHDIQAGFFPGFQQMVDYLLFGAQYGLFFSLNGAVQSLPFSLLAYIAAVILVSVFMKRFVLSKSENVSLHHAGG
jgi:hypothetical protein